MKLTALERYEIIAEAFYLTHGKMAPGKSVPAEIAMNDMEERWQLWETWSKTSRPLIDAMLLAVERTLPDEEVRDDR